MSAAKKTAKMEWATKEDLVGYIDDARKRIRLSLLEMTIMADAAGGNMVIEERDLARARDRLFEGERALRVALDMVKELPAKSKPRAWRAPVIDLGAKRRQRQPARGPPREEGVGVMSGPKKKGGSAAQITGCLRAPADELKHTALEMRRYIALARKASSEIELDGSTPERLWRLRSFLRLADVFSELVVRDALEPIYAARDADDRRSRAS